MPEKRQFHPQTMNRRAGPSYGKTQQFGLICIFYCKYYVIRNNFDGQHLGSLCQTKADYIAFVCSSDNHRGNTGWHCPVKEYIEVRKKTGFIGNPTCDADLNQHCSEHGSLLRAPLENQTSSSTRFKECSHYKPDFHLGLCFTAPKGSIYYTTLVSVAGGKTL